MADRLAPLQIVTGKGGVGKSTLALALALGAARRGLRVLAVALGEHNGMAGLLGLPSQPHGVAAEVAPGLRLTRFEGEQALAEYLTRRLPLGRVLDAVVTHPIYRAFIDAGPGVRELMAVGKVRDELLGLSGQGGCWDVVVVDAGASGHALQLLGMPAATARTFRSGLAHREAAAVAATLADPQTTAVHVVALPEEMPLEEAAQVLETLRQRRLPVGRLFVNQCLGVPPPQARAQVQRLAGEPDAGAFQACLLELAGRVSLRVEQEQTAIKALEARVALPALQLPWLLAPRFGRAELDHLSDLLWRDTK